MPIVKIDVTLKPSLLDAQGRVVQSALHKLGYENVESVRIGRHIEVDMPDSADINSKIDEMCVKLLSNPVIEDYTYEVVK
jgi:phosphoribosylformylglycinamidine synthase